MWLKWLFNALLFLWLYHAVVRPLFLGYFYGNKSGSEQKPAPSQGVRQQPPPPKPKKYDDEDGEYVDYEEVK
jgi:hypothetical protein